VGEDPRNAGKSQGRMVPTQPCAGRETDGMCGNGNGTGLKLPLRQMWFKKRIAEGRERSDDGRLGRETDGPGAMVGSVNF
jgi:hypothetical protein